MNAIDRIVSVIPRQFWLDNEEATTTAFVEAHNVAKEQVEEPERVGMRAQLRHAKCEAGFRSAAIKNGLNAIAPHTVPAGGRYSILESGGVYLLRGNIQRHCGVPRPTAFRKLYSEHNAWLKPVQPSLLWETPVPSDKALTAFLIVTAYAPRIGDQTVPAYIGLGIPRDDMRGWLKTLSTPEILAYYHEGKELVEAPIEVRDVAIPRLKPEQNT